MFRSRAVQYLGLALLVAASLGIIFYPVGPTPQPKDFTITLTSPTPWADSAKAAAAKDKKLAGKDASKIADIAFLKAFPNPPLPKDLVIDADGTTATVSDTAATRKQAADRTLAILAALQGNFPGVTIAAKTQQVIDNYPPRPLFSLGSYSIFPMQRATAIKLGLDLRGGVNLVLQIRRAMFTYTFDPAAAPDAQAREVLFDKVRSALKAAPSGDDLTDADIRFTDKVPNQIEVRTQAATREEFDVQTKAITAALQSIPNAGFKPAGAPQFFDPAGTTAKGQATDPNLMQENLDQTLEIIRSRVDKLGVSEPLIQEQGTSRIIVQLPGIKDPQRAIETIGSTAHMRIVLLPENLQPVYTVEGADVTFKDKKTQATVPNDVVLAQSELLVDGKDVVPTTEAGMTNESATPEPAVFFDLQGDGRVKFADVTGQVAGKGRFIPIFLDDRCISAPTVNAAIDGKGEISGGFKTIDEANQLKLLLNSGALPAPIDVVENRTVSATLGTDSLIKSLNAGLIGLLAVALFMICFYRLPGLLANFALVIYIVVNLGSFILIGGTLTLPGIAGFLLAIAMSLDTNILVFERLKEEMAMQPSFSAALRAAFSRAWTAILDSHVTTLIAALVLFNFGTGPVKGFALTLGVGVLLSLFSAISVTRLFMWSIVHVGETNHKLFGKPAHVTVPVAAPTK